jgi:hypothetical protein
MDRLTELSAQLSTLLTEIDQEARRRGARELMAPLAWLAEADGWLEYELARRGSSAPVDPVPFTYVPLETRR